MALEFNTAGFAIKYAVETTAGTRPTTGYTNIPDIVSLPELNTAPSTINVTPLSELVRMRYIPGLADDGGTFGMNANMTTSFKTAWEALCTAASTGKAAGKSTWFEIVFPSDSGYTDSFYFSGEPTVLGFAGAEVNTAYQGNAYITTNTITGFSAAST